MNSDYHMKQIIRTPKRSDITVFSKAELKGFHPVGMEASGKYCILCGRPTMLPISCGEGTYCNFRNGDRTRKFTVLKEEIRDCLETELIDHGGYIVLIRDQEVVDVKKVYFSESGSTGWQFCREDGSDITELLVAYEEGYCPW